MKKILVMLVVSSLGMVAFASGRMIIRTYGENDKSSENIETLSNSDNQKSASRGYSTGQWTYWHDNGQIKSQGQFVDDKWSGKWVNWYPNGEKKNEGHYLDGKLHGHWTYWHDNGTKQSEGKYIKGKKAGRWIFWHRNGQKKSEGDYN